MKKLLIISAMLSIGLVTFGQKQQTDSRTLEVNFTPFGNNPVSITGIKFRSFSSDYSAMRLNVWLSNNSNKTVSMQAATNGFPDNPNPLTNSISSNFDLLLSPGIEKHFDGTSRLSPYIGAELNISLSSSSQTEEYWSSSTLVAPATAFSTHTEWDQTVKNGSFGLGAGALAGMDFYFADNIYFGTEFGFGLMFTSFSDTKYTASDNNAWAVAAINGGDVNFGAGETTIDAGTGEITAVTVRPNDANGSSFYIGPRVNGAIRLGFVF